MTEAEWLACTDPRLMLEFLRGKTSDRKVRLFAVACCRHHGKFMAAQLRRALVEAVERYTDGEVGWDAVAAAGAAIRFAGPIGNAITTHLTHPDGLACVHSILADWREWYAARSLILMASLLRDIFGNPCRPVSLNSGWRTPIVASLAQATYEDRRLPSGELDPVRVAILADALEDAGCFDCEVLSHCRGPGPHVRGCFVVGALLGKT